MDIQTTGDTQVDTKLVELSAVILEGDIPQTKVVLQELHDMALSSPELANWIIIPANVTRLHEELIESLGVAPRTMQLRHRIPQFRKRAVYFFKAMQNGVNRLDANS